MANEASSEGLKFINGDMNVFHRPIERLITHLDILDVKCVKLMYRGEWSICFHSLEWIPNCMSAGRGVA